MLTLNRAFLIFFCFQSCRCWPIVDGVVQDVDKQIDAEDFSTPDEESGRNLQALVESSRANPEERGNYFEGDIMLPPRSLSRNGLRNESYRWPNGEIPYIIVGSFSSESMDMIKRAMDIYHKNTCIKFVPVKKTDKNFIIIDNDNTGCWSYVGKQRRRQPVNLQTPICTTKIGTILHELMHACGFDHEQNRPDRDDYITVEYSNINRRSIANFNKASQEKFTTFGEAYDYGSVMHYSEYAFSENGKATIVPKDPKAVGKLGQREGFSKSDLKKLNIMYKCSDVASDFTTKMPENGSRKADGSGNGIISALQRMFG